MSAASPPQSVEEALHRAGRHARNAVAEAIAAARALLDAASLVAARLPAGESAIFSPIAHLLDALEEQVGRAESASHDYTAPLVAALAEALDAEIARWEMRAKRDPDARAVLRAFLGLRELLWEIGVRTTDPDDGAEPARDESAQGRGEAPRVQRIRVNG